MYTENSLFVVILFSKDTIPCRKPIQVSIKAHLVLFLYELTELLKSTWNTADITGQKLSTTSGQLKIHFEEKKNPNKLSSRVLVPSCQISMGNTATNCQIHV